MPLYEYRCKRCDEVFEVLQLRSKEEERVRCPRCGSEEVERLLSACSLGGSCGASRSFFT
ncbi:MAG: zinc ribbon domain-containing protein [Deltaproteobacteria bacterium]|nr:MAG: zinc ribbon domain-containing protein [Deltaproteobacteria bacterium]RLB01623.1 MAG: zinc ribbon domain-containing protein [Deltaproteobacteria bacterium]